MENLGLSREMMQEKIQQVATFFEIEAFLAQPLYQLSGGQKQTVAFASSLLPTCQILFLDEVASNLDKTGLAKLKQTLKHLKRSGVALVLVEHRLDYCLDLIDRIYVLENGQLKQELSAAELKTYSTNELVGFGLRHWQAAVNQTNSTNGKERSDHSITARKSLLCLSKAKRKANCYFLIDVR
ncbi:ATP-binding cassette domain-containing protein [Enterococcus cecorum]